MRINDEKVWLEWKKNNQDEYGQAILDYAERWANLMETEIEKGYLLEAIASSLSHEADTEGITGFMYGAAVSILASCWEYGERLNRWHNRRFQIQEEGEEANEKGKTLNPALLSISI